MEMAISDLNIRQPNSLFADFARWRAENGFRRLDKIKLNELTSVFAEFVHWRAESALRQVGK